MGVVGSVELEHLWEAKSIWTQCSRFILWVPAVLEWGLGACMGPRDFAAWEHHSCGKGMAAVMGSNKKAVYVLGTQVSGRGMDPRISLLLLPPPFRKCLK